MDDQILSRQVCQCKNHGLTALALVIFDTLLFGCFWGFSHQNNWIARGFAHA